MIHDRHVGPQSAPIKETLSPEAWIRRVLRDDTEDDVLFLFESNRYLPMGRSDVVRVRGRRATFDTGPEPLPRIGPPVDVDAVLRAHSKTSSTSRTTALGRLSADLRAEGRRWDPPSPRGTADLQRRQIFATVSLDLCDWFGMSATARRAEFASELARAGRTRRSAALSRRTEAELARRVARLRWIERKNIPVTYRLAGTPLVDPPHTLESGRSVVPGETFTTSVLTLLLQDWLESGKIEKIASEQTVITDEQLDAANRRALDSLSELCAGQREKAGREAERQRARGANARSDSVQDRSLQRSTQRLVVAGRALLSDLGAWPWACFPEGRLPGTRRNAWRTTDRTAEDALLRWLHEPRS